jgi:GT2 family glycosyltransferase
MEELTSNYKISVIASNFNGEKYLPKLVETLQGQKGVELQIIIVDRESCDASLEIINSYNVELVSEPPEHGLVAGYHKGFKHAKHDLLFFCNEDMWFDEWCLYNCAKHIDLEKRIASSDPWQWTYDGKELAHAGVRFNKEFSAFYLSHVIPFVGMNPLVDLKEGEFIPLSSAGACIIHRVAYIECGGWDTSFFLDAEEEDLFLRFRQHGWKAVTVPSAKVYHAISVSTSKMVKKTSVKKKRFISGLSNKTIITIKYLPFSYILKNLMARVALMFGSIFKGKFKQSWYVFLSFFLTAKRLKYALTFRKEYGEKNGKNNIDYYLAFFQH